MQLVPLRPFDRVVAGYATFAFALGAGESAAVHEWSFALLGAMLAAAGAGLLLIDHRRWRAARRTAAPENRCSPPASRRAGVVSSIRRD